MNKKLICTSIPFLCPKCNMFYLFIESYTYNFSALTEYTPVESINPPDQVVCEDTHGCGWRATLAGIRFDESSGFTVFCNKGLWSTILKSDRKTAIELLTDALLTDGGHHKQWYIERALEALGINLNGLHKQMQLRDNDWEEGIAP